MAEEKVEQRPATWRQLLPWTVLFRGFQVALDPKKLLLAAAGIVVMSVCWWLLAVIFYNSRSVPDENKYRDRVTEYQKDGMDPVKAQERATADYNTDVRKYDQLKSMAGENGQLRTLPWTENRGPNPYLLVTGQAGSPRDPGFYHNLGEFGAFLVEPLVKFLYPVVLLLHPDAGFWNRVYFLLVILSTLATWAVFGGAITRIAVVQVARNEKIRIVEALRFVVRHYLSYLSAPLFPLGLVALMLLGLMFFGVIHMIPVVGEIWSGILWPVVLLGCLAMAVVLVGLVGWPLMYATISAEGSDAFDGISRSYSYVYQSPWNFLGYSLVALAYGVVVVFFVGFMGSLTVYLAKWGTNMGTFVSSRDPGFLCVYAPTSFQWRTVLLQGTTLDNGDPLVVNGQIDPVRFEAYKATFKWYNYIGAGLVSFWVGLFFLMIIGFGYSYFWSACTIIYLLMRRQVDDTDMDEVYLEEEEEENYSTGDAAPAGAAATSGPTTSLTMVEAPTLRPSAPPVAPPPPPAPAAVPAETSSKNGGDGESAAKAPKTTDI